MDNTRLIDNFSTGATRRSSTDRGTSTPRFVESEIRFANIDFLYPEIDPDLSSTADAGITQRLG